MVSTSAQSLNHSGGTQDSTPPLQAVILAAGFARRMQPLSDNCHKALLSVGGSTILGRIMDGLEHVGVNLVTVVTGYRSDDIEAFLLSNYPQVNFRFVKNENFRGTNNIVSLSLAFDAMDFEQDVILIECDLLFDTSLMSRLVDHPGKNVALVDHYRTGMDGTVVEIEDGFVSDVYPTDTQGADFSYANKFKTLNIYKFDRLFCQKTFRPLLHTYANDIDSSVYYELVLGMLTNMKSNRINAEVVAGERWAEVDDPNDLAVASFQFEPTKREAILDASFGGHWNFDIIDFSFMRNSYYPTASMLANMRHALPQLLANYGSAQVILNEKLGFFLKCNPNQLQVLHGASQIFPILGRIFADSKILIPTATFGEYSRHFPLASTYTDAPGVDWAEIEDSAANFDVVVVVNPNTSTGTLLNSEEIHSLAKRTPNTLFFVDESFLAFSGETPVMKLLEDDPLKNVVVLVSMSKSLGVPGLRLGYVYSRDLSFIESIGTELPVWNLSAPGEFLLELLLKFGPAYDASLLKTSQDRDALRLELLKLPFIESIPASGGNFLLMELVGEAAGVAGQARRWLLERYNIEVKDVSGKFKDRKPRLRIAVRTEADNMILTRALSELSPEILALGA